jgi:hypothetical protein
MRKQISSAGRGELLRAVAERYKQTTRGERMAILDEFVAITGYHRKHAIRVLSADDPRPLKVRRTRLRLYDEAVREALVVLWEASHRDFGHGGNCTSVIGRPKRMKRSSAEKPLTRRSRRDLQMMCTSQRRRN